MQTMRRTSHPRRGAVLLVVMFCLLVISLLTTSLLKSVLFQQRQMLREQRQHQARWLLQSGLERAADRLNHDENYSGETWAITAEELQGSQSGEVRIVIEPAPQENPGETKLTVTARYPLEFDTIQLTRTRIIPRKAISGETP